MATTGEELVGTSVAGYAIVERIGRGATGVVYRATKDGRDVAFKVLNPALANLDTLRRRFLREARALTQLDHPNVVAIDDFGVEGELAYIAMELLEGETLEDALESAPLPPARALEIMTQVLQGLAFAHARQIVHRDLKPANVFLPRGGEVRVLDFGLAKFLSIDEVSSEGTLTRRGRVVGTPAYMAPEQISGASLDVRADVYAAGTLLFELLADRRPFPYTRRSALLRAHLFEDVPRLASVRPGLVVDEGLEAVVRRALAKDPAERFADAGAMLEALRVYGPEAVRHVGVEPERPRRSATDTRSVVITDDERAQALRQPEDPAAPLEAADRAVPDDAPPADEEEPAPESPPIAAPPRPRPDDARSGPDWWTIAVWVVGLVALVGLYALGAYATTLR